MYTWALNYLIKNYIWKAHVKVIYTTYKNNKYTNETLTFLQTLLPILSNSSRTPVLLVRLHGCIYIHTTSNFEIRAYTKTVGIESTIE